MAVRAERKYHSGRTIQLTGQQDSVELSIVIGNQTDVFVTLSEPVAVVEPNGTIGKAEILRFRADVGTITTDPDNQDLAKHPHIGISGRCWQVAPVRRCGGLTSADVAVGSTTGTGPAVRVVE
jgi:hypothetical protein